MDTRARVVAFEAVIPVGAFETLALSGVTPNIGHAFPGFGNRVTTEDGSVVAVAVARPAVRTAPTRAAARQCDPGQRESAPDHPPPPVHLTPTPNRTTRCSFPTWKTSGTHAPRAFRRKPPA